MHDVPEGTDLADLIFGLVSPPRMTAKAVFPAGDRHAAIVCAAAIEHVLKRAIALHLAPDADLRKVFEEYPSAPLSSFAARTAMARALGIVDTATETDLHVIRSIRNYFAHSVLPISFSNPDLSHLVFQIKKLLDPTWSLFNEQYADPRDRYVISCAVHYIALERYSVAPRIKTNPEQLDDVLQSLREAPASPSLLGDAFGDQDS